MDIWKKINDLGDFYAIDYIGVAALTNYHAELQAIGGSLTDRFPRALSIGIILPQTIVELLADRNSYENTLQYETHAYQVINQRLDLFSSIISSVIQKNGYQAMPLPAAERIDSERVCATMPHKAAAYLAGFGWIGKNCLLITPDNGPRVRWTTVLTDAPLAENHTIMDTRCGGCTACTAACPAQAIKGRAFSRGEGREMRLDVAKCENYFKTLKDEGKLPICGMCLYICPHGKSRRT
ncbi:MAG: 4Fe-4S double cluster binding domain-containing protein [Veillonellales bacterium]